MVLNKVNLLVLFLIVASIALIPVASRLRVPKVLAQPADKIDIYLQTPDNVQTGEKFSAEVKINSYKLTISAVELHVDYPTDKFRATSITVGEFLPVIPKCAVGGPNYYDDPTGNTPCSGGEGDHPLAQGQIDENLGRASITLGSEPNNPMQGSGTLARINFEVLTASSPSSIRVGSNTRAAAITEGGTNVFCQFEVASSDLDCSGNTNILDALKWRRLWLIGDNAADLNTDTTTNLLDYLVMLLAWW